MKIVYVLAYPIYHDFWTKDQWLNILNQNRWLPGILANMGFESELWVVDITKSTHESELNGFKNYTIRMFEPDKQSGKTKFHTSKQMVDFAKQNSADLFLINGVDGGIGDHLITSFLSPNAVPFVMVTGGQYHHPNNKLAEYVLYESEYQRRFLTNPKLFFWRNPIPNEKLIRLQKSVDVEVFKPFPGINKKYDAISVGRIVKNNKRFDEIGKLARHFKVAVLGDGPYKNNLMRRYPDIIWLDRVPNSEVPQVINQSKTYIHPSAKDWVITRDFYPRAVAEALACGIPCIGFSDAIQTDIIPEDCGIIIKRENVVEACTAFFKLEEKIQYMAINAREYAEAHLHKYSAQPALVQLFLKMGISHQ
jgi:glycosyltransferase involved in cell wall biosynthesis